MERKWEVAAHLVVAGPQQRRHRDGREQAADRLVRDRLLEEGVAHLVVRLHQLLILEQVELGVVVDDERRTLEAARPVRHRNVDTSSGWRRIRLLLAGRSWSEKRRSEGKCGPTKIAGQIIIDISTAGC